MLRRLARRLVGAFFVGAITASLAVGCRHAASQGARPTLQWVGEILFTNGNASGLVRYGDCLYMVMNESATPLLVYDIRDPQHPHLLRRLSAPGWPMRCRLVGNRWLWTVHGNGEGFFDLSDPTKPRLAGEREGPPLKFVSRERFRLHPNFTYQTCAFETTLFYGTDKGTTEIYDIAVPQNPKHLATILTGVPMLLDRKRLFVSGDKNPVQLWDVSDPAKPRLVGELVADGLPFEVRGSAVAIGDGKLFVGVRADLPNLFGAGPFPKVAGGIAVFDTERPGRWGVENLLGFTVIPNAISDITTLAYHKGHVFASDTAFGLRVFNVREPKALRQVMVDRQGGELSAVAFLPKRHLLAVGQNLSGSVFLVDVADPQRPQRLGFFHHFLRVWGTMAASPDERYLYFQADLSRPIGMSTLFTLDLQDPSHPQLTSVVHGVARAYGLVVVDSTLYSSGGDIFDLHDPARPQRLPVRLPCDGYQIAHRDFYLFVAHFAAQTPQGQQGLLSIVDIRQRTRPRLVAQLPLPFGHRVITMAFLGRYLFLGWAQRTSGRRPSGLIVAVDIADPAHPRLVGQWDIATDLGMPEFITYAHVWTDGKWLFIGCYRSHLGVFTVREQGSRVQLHKVAMLSGLPTAWLMAGEQGWVYRVGLDRIVTIRIAE